MILGAIDRKLATARPKSEPVNVDYEKLHIEHLLPQSWREHWPLSDQNPAAAQLAAEKRDHVLHRIGNLTLLTGVLNPALSNGPWESKRSEIARHSKLHLNSDFLYDITWDETAIASRGRHLAEVAVTIWPAPGAP